jgi:hypothetical protein
VCAEANGRIIQRKAFARRPAIREYSRTSVNSPDRPHPPLLLSEGNARIDVAVQRAPDADAMHWS